MRLLIAIPAITGMIAMIALIALIAAIAVIGIVAVASGVRYCTLSVYCPFNYSVQIFRI